MKNGELEGLRIQTKRALRQLGQLQNTVYLLQNALTATAEELIVLAQALGIEVSSPPNLAQPPPASSVEHTPEPPIEQPHKIE